MGFIKDLYFKPINVNYMTFKELLFVMIFFPFLMMYGSWKYYVTKAWKEEFDNEERIN